MNRSALWWKDRSETMSAKELPEKLGTLEEKIHMRFCFPKLTNCSGSKLN